MNDNLDIMKSIVFVLLFGFASFVCAQDIEILSKEGNPIEGVADFGSIENGAKAEKTFLVKNTGDSPLILKTARASCGCTVPTYPKEPIMPGATAEMTVQYKTTSQAGKFNKTVTIYSNAVGKERTIFRVKGEILEKV